MLAALSAVIIGITQTTAFRTWLKEFIVTTAAAELNGTLSIGSIHGNLITGVRLDSVAITMNGKPVISCFSVTARYNPLRLPSQFAALAELSIREPHLVLEKAAGDSLWNLERLGKPKQTASAPFAWTIDARDVEIQNGSIDINDPAAAPTTPSAMSLTRMSLRGMNLSAAAKVSRLVQDITINHISFDEPVTAFRLCDVSGSVYLAPDTMVVSLARVVTKHSGLSLALGMGAADSAAHGTGLARLAHVPFAIALDADSISFDEAKLFTPALAPLARSVSLELNARGTLSDLAIKKCVLKLDHSDVNIAGSVQHLDMPARITGDVQITKSQIIPAEVVSRLPGVAMPDLSGLGTVQIAQLSVKGSLKDAATKFAIMTGAGSVSGTAGLNVTDSIPAIAADVTLGNVNLALIARTLPQSIISGHVTVKGTGSSVMTFAGPVTTDLFNTTITGRRLDRFTTRALLTRGAVRIDTLSGALADSGGTFALYGTADLHNGVDYDLHLATDGLNVATMTKDEKYTELTLHSDIRGHGVSLDSLALDPLKISVAESKLYGRRVPPFSATISIVHPAPGKTSMMVTSDIGVLTMNGTYRFDQAIDRLVGLGNDVAILSLDSISPAFVPGMTLPPPDTILQPVPAYVDAAFTIVVTNPQLIAAFLETTLGGRSVINGTVHADSLGAHETIDASFGGFTLTKKNCDMRLGKTKIGIEFNRAFTLTSVPVPGAVPVAVPVSAAGRTGGKRGRATAQMVVPTERRIKSVKERIALFGIADSLRVNDVALRGPKFHFNLDNGVGRFGAECAVPGEPLQVAGFSAQTTFARGACTALFDTIRFGRGPYVQWHLAEPGAIVFDHGAVNIQHLALTGDSAIVRCAGTFADGSFANMHVSASAVRLADLKKYGDVDLFRGLEGSIDSLAAVLNGPLADPHIQIPVLRGDNIAFRGNMFGPLSAAFDGFHKNVVGEIHLGEPAVGRGVADEAPQHRLDIEVRAFPFDCALGAAPQRIPDGAATDVRTRATAFPITFLELLFGSTVDQLRGNATGKLAISGNTPSVRYNGSMALSDVRFRAIASNLSYEGRGDILMYNDTLEITSAEIANRKEDLAQSWARLWGNLYFRGLRFDSFDVYCEADQIRVLSRASQRPNSAVFGPLDLSTQPRTRRVESLTPNPANAVHFYGTLSRPTLEGTLYTQFSDLTFPQWGASGDEAVFGVVYDLDAIRHAENGNGGHNGVRPPGAPGTTTLESPVPVEEGGLLDRMRYNLKIKTERDLQLTMAFSDIEKLKDIRLTGELNFIRGDDGRAHLSGPLYINGGTYSFYDEFTVAQGSRMEFVDSMENPRLSITALTPPRIHEVAGRPTEFVQVAVDIAGTRQQPQMTVRLLTGPNSNAMTERGGNADVNRADAILFLATQQFVQDFNVSQGAGYAASTQGATIGASMLSQALGSIVKNQLGLPGTVSVQLDKDLAKSRLSASGQFGKFLVSAGLKGTTNLDASVSFSLGDALGVVWLEQTRIAAERRSVETTTEAVKQDPVYSLRLGMTDMFTGAWNGMKAFFRWVTGTTPAPKSVAPVPVPSDTNAVGRVTP